MVLLQYGPRLDFLSVWRGCPQLCRKGPVVKAQGDAYKSRDDENIWGPLAFPSYLQSRVDNLEVCKEFAEAVNEAERQQYGADPLNKGKALQRASPTDAVWQAIRREAEKDAATEPLLSSFLYASILAHDSFERALAFVLANRLASPVMLPTQLFEIFHSTITSDVDVRDGALADVEAFRDRDPACCLYSHALLYFKGFHAIQTHRMGHALWQRGQKVMALALQSRMSEVFGVDIHPAARIGRGILLDHGSGVVIGETAVVGNNCSLLQNVTLGGTGKEVGDRHPKVSDNVLIGASATILGNITIGKGAQIAAGSLVLKPVPPHTMVAGSPAKPVGKVVGNPALKMQHWTRKLVEYDPFCPEPPQATTSAAGQGHSHDSPPVGPVTHRQPKGDDHHQAHGRGHGSPHEQGGRWAHGPGGEGRNRGVSNRSHLKLDLKNRGHSQNGHAHHDPADVHSKEAPPSTAPAVMPVAEVEQKSATTEDMGPKDEAYRAGALVSYSSASVALQVVGPVGDSAMSRNHTRTGEGAPEDHSKAGDGDAEDDHPGVLAMSVDATTDDIDAAIKWPSRPDPEYII